MNRTTVLWLVVVASLMGATISSGSQKNPEQSAVQRLETAAKTEAADMEIVGEAHSGYLDQGASTVVSVQLDRARCYRFIAVGASGVTDLSIAVNAHNKEVASDRISGKTLVAKWCSPGRVKVKIKLTIYNGSGAFALGVYGKKDAAKKDVEKVGGEGSDFIATRIRQMYAKFGKNRKPASPVLRGNLSTGNHKSFPIRLQGGHCYTILSAGSPSVRNLNLELIAPTGRELNRDQSKNSYPMVESDPCIRIAGEHTVRVYMYSGFGQFGLQLFTD